MINHHSMHRARESMIAALSAKGISGLVLQAMSRVPRHLFVSEALRYRAYDDSSLPIGFGQTISKPSVIASMVQSLGLCGGENVLEIGTGSGYQTAVLAELGASCVTVERIRELSERARSICVSLGYSAMRFIHSDNLNSIEGTFDAIIVAAGASELPIEYFSRLKECGTLVIPVAEGGSHRIMRHVIRGGRAVEDHVGMATFVPLL
jgi:protein-L-isoaspartate(D-aspartate) O-methyltransferase